MKEKKLKEVANIRSRSTSSVPRAFPLVHPTIQIIKHSLTASRTRIYKPRIKKKNRNWIIRTLEKLKWFKWFISSGADKPSARDSLLHPRPSGLGSYILLFTV
jgi:hypothetical protein